jgi:hypothetical protein
MGRPRQSECHNWNETLATSQDAAVERRDFSQKVHRFVNRLRCMVLEGSNLHLGPVSAVAALKRFGNVPNAAPPISLAAPVVL